MHVIVVNSKLFVITFSFKMCVFATPINGTLVNITILKKII